MSQNYKLKKAELIYPELSYKIVGILFEVSNKLGFGHREATVEKAVKEALLEDGLKFTQQHNSVLILNGKPIRKYKIDFIIDGKIALELKSKHRFNREDISQLYDYLKSQNLKLGILANFGRNGVTFKRLVNKI